MLASYVWTSLYKLLFNVQTRSHTKSRNYEIQTPNFCASNSRIYCLTRSECSIASTWLLASCKLSKQSNHNANSGTFACACAQHLEIFLGISNTGSQQISPDFQRHTFPVLLNTNGATLSMQRIFFANQSTNQPTNQPTNQSINQSINQSKVFIYTP